MTWIDRTPQGIEIERRPYRVANCGSRWTDPTAANRVTLHTTESTRRTMRAILDLWDSAERRGTLTVPHFTIDPGTLRMAQHRDLYGPACALEGCSNGSVSTNGVPNVQVEICGRAAESPFWSDEDLEFIGDWLAAVRKSGFEFPFQSGVTFYSDKNAPYVLASYSSPLRLQGEAWRRFSGVLGHVHVPCNAHWDPGGLDIGRILYHAATIYGGKTNDEELSMGDISKLEEQYSALSEQVAKMSRDIAGWMQQERAYDGLVPVKLPNDPRQYLVVLIPGKGFAKVHLTGEAKGVMQKQQTIQTAPTSFESGHPVDFVTITDQKQIEWLVGLPTL